MYVAFRGDNCIPFLNLVVVHFDWYGGGYLANMTRKISMISEVQVVVAMATRSVIFSSEQFNVVWRRVIG